MQSSPKDPSKVAIAKDTSGVAALGARIRCGDQNAFEQVFRRYYEPLCRYSRRYTGSMAAAEDVVQELFSRLWERRTHWNPTSIKNYLYASVRNRSINAAKRNKRQVAFDKGAAASQVNGSADSRMAHEELHRQVQQALSMLSDRQREVFYLSRNAGCSHQEIADILGVSVHTVETHMARALEKLHERLHRIKEGGFSES